MLKKQLEEHHKMMNVCKGTAMKLGMKITTTFTSTECKIEVYDLETKQVIYQVGDKWKNKTQAMQMYIGVYKQFFVNMFNFGLTLMKANYNYKNKKK
jgi:hypothetical protein